jgi:hypothetical protein
VVLELGEVRVRVVVGAKQRQWGLIVVVGRGGSHDKEEGRGRSILDSDIGYNSITNVDMPYS